jgi:NADH-quinone oxidoreductase subunit N
MIEPVSVSFESLKIATLMPMLLAISGGLLILLIDLLKSHLDKSIYIVLSVMFIVMDLGSVLSLELNSRGFFDVIFIDGIAMLSQIVILVTSMLFIAFAFASNRFHEYQYPEFFALFLFMTAGFQFMVASDNLITIFVGLETASLSLYTMIVLHNKDKSFEAAIKYFTMGAVAAGFYAFGSMILYGLTGSVELYKIFEVLEARTFEPMILIIVSSLFFIGAFGFKLAIVPFHTWGPDVYEGSSAALAGYISIVPKIASFVVVMRIFEQLIHSGVDWVQGVLYAIVVITMTMANIWALIQNDVKRMLAYSSISHTGFVMSAIMIGTTQSNSGIFLYWIMFAFANLGAFAMLWASRKRGIRYHERYDHPFEKFAGMVKLMPLGAVMMGLFMLTLAGIPPFSVFWGKLYLISSAINANFTGLAIIMALNSAIAVFYYLKLVIFMFLKDPVSSLDGSVYMTNASISLKVVLGLLAFFTVISIFFVNPILEMASYFIAMSGF